MEGERLADGQSGTFFEGALIICWGPDSYRVSVFVIQRGRQMSLGRDTIEPLLAIAAGSVTIAKGEAWIGPALSPSFVFKGAVAFAIGALTMVLGVILSFTK